MTDCVSLWIGKRLGAVERACLRSVARQGHRVSLYCYERPEGVPERVETRDARDIIPEASIFRNRAGSVGHFSDWFRYELQKRSLGTWVDTDIYLLRPLDGEKPDLFGEQAPGVINNAILRLAPSSPLLPELLRPFEQRTTPHWLPIRSWLSARLREFASGEADLGRLPWGSTGPYALTTLARRHSLLAKAVPPEVFYPVPWQKALWIVDPTVVLEDVCSRDTVAVHLWNECVKDVKNTAGPEGSFLSRLQREGAE